MNTKARLIAFYLPQYHPIPENDEWWGKGFTEWTNVANAKPLFPGHYQPHIPADLGFYDLRVSETRIAQAEMAKEYGIEAFCYWHYWFAGKRLLERPFNEVLASGDPDFPFCLAWANQSWTGVWHGAPDRALQEQTYPGLKDHEEHFHTLLRAFVDDRYLTVEGKPLFVVWRAMLLPDSKRVTDLWRELALKAGLKGLHIVGFLKSDESATNLQERGFDATVIDNPSRILARFSSSGVSNIMNALRQSSLYRTGKLFLRTIGIGGYTKFIRRTPRVYRFDEAIRHMIMPQEREDNWYPCTIPNWDNTPRCGLDGVVFDNATPKLFEKHLKDVCEAILHKPHERRIIFIKAWNEWAEGNHLEPDLKFGRGYLEAIKRCMNGKNF